MPRRVYARGYRRTKRPIGKNLVAVNKNSVTSQVSTVIIPGSVVAKTVTGFRWYIDCHAVSASIPEVIMAIAVVRDGESIGTLSAVDGFTLYAPEENCIAALHGTCENTTGTVSDLIWSDSTTISRKLGKGDSLLFTITASAAVNVTGFVQCFEKQ